MLTQLFENVSFWSERGRPEIAARELERILSLTPHNPNTLAIAARLAFRIGDFDAGERYRNHLHDIAPNDPRMAALATERALSPADQDRLREARALATAGEKAEAVKAYRLIFNDHVPDSSATEFYVTLGTASADGFDEASEQLSLAADRWPGDATFKLALGKLETYGEGSRAAGIERLRQLTHVTSVAVGARAAWREALLWQGADAQVLDQFKQYLAENPPDPEISAKMKEIEGSLPDAGLINRMLAYEAVTAGNQDEAERYFLAALQHDPNDAEAMIMLSLIRRSQKRIAESDELIAKAIDLAPDRRDEFVNDIGFDPVVDAARQAIEKARGTNERQNTGPRVSARNGGDGGASAHAYARINRIADQGNYAAAEAGLRKLMGARPVAGGYVQLGYLQLRAGQLAPAEDSFRRAMAAGPRVSGAAVGLATVLERQGRSDEAEKALAQAGNVAGVQGVRQARASMLRDQAQKEADPATRIVVLQQAVATDPSFPWSRLELARALDGQSQHAQALQVMNDAIAGPHPSKDQVQATLIYAQEQGDLARASQLIDLVPAKDRTPEMRSIQQQAVLRSELDSAQAGGDRATRRARLLQVAAGPTPAAHARRRSPGACSP